MTTPRTNAGDPARTIALLWRDELGAGAAARGPRQGLSVDDIVDAAVVLADTEGLEAVTMRRLATAAGTAPMTLYTYVAGREELLDLMLDRVYGQVRRRSTASRPWRQRVRAVARANRALLQLHPWVAFVATTRPGLGPGALAKYDHELAAFAGLGLDDVTMDAALGWTLAFVHAWGRSNAEATAAQRDSAQDEQQWWAAVQPLLAKVLGPDDFPLATRVGAAAGLAHGAAWSADHAFDFGLARVLDGLAAIVEPPPR